MVGLVFKMEYGNTVYKELDSEFSIECGMAFKLFMGYFD